MQENQNYDDEIDARELFSALWRGKYFIIIFTMISLAAGSLYLRTISSKYRVSILLAPVQEEQTSPNFGKGRWFSVPCRNIFTNRQRF